MNHGTILRGKWGRLLAPATVALCAVLCAALLLMAGCGPGRGAGEASLARSSGGDPRPSGASSGASELPGLSVEGEEGLVVRSAGYYRDNAGQSSFFGEVVNEGDRTVAAAEVEVGLYDGRGEEVADGESFDPCPSVLRPGQKAVWHAWIGDAPRKWRGTKLRVGRYSYLDPEEVKGSFRSGLEVRDARLLPPAEYGGAGAEARVINAGDETARRLEGRAALYDPEGNLVEVSSMFADTDNVKPAIEPGAELLLEGSFFRPDGEVTRGYRVEVYVSGERD